MLSRLRHTREKLPIDDQQAERLQRAFYVFCLMGSGGIAITGAIYQTAATVIGAALVGTSVLLCIALTRHGQAIAARVLLLSTTTLVVVDLAWRGGGIHDISVAFLPLVVVFSGILLGRRAAVVFAMLGGAAATGLVWGDLHGLTGTGQPLRSDPGDALSVSILLAIAAGIMWYVMDSLGNSLLAARASGERLEIQADELRASEARWRSLVQHAPNRIMNVDREGTVLFTNEEQAMASAFDLVRPEERVDLRATLDHVFDGRGAIVRELRGPGEGETLAIRVGPIERDGAVAGATLVVSDVSERVRAEEERKNLEARLRTAQKMESLGQLAGGIAHDFNNLLTVISGNSALLEEAVREPWMHESVSEIRAAQERAASLVRQLLAFGGRQLLRPEVLELNTCVGGICGMLRRLLGGSVEFRFLPTPTLAPVLADPGQIEQVLVNLVLNARDALGEGGHLEIRTASRTLVSPMEIRESVVEPGEYVVLSVSDDGPGMDEETQSQIFEPFFTTKSRSRGSGLGLSSAYGIVTQSGGSMRVESGPGKGATFEILLPAHRGRPAPEVAPALEVAGQQHGNERILIVEDDDALRRLLGRALSQRGFEVVAAADGAEALGLAETRGPFQLVVTDLVMPGISGKTFADRFLESHDGVPVVFMSGYADEVLGERGMLPESVNFIQKPFLPLDLVAKIRELLGESDPSDPVASSRD